MLISEIQTNLQEINNITGTSITNINEYILPSNNSFFNINGFVIHKIELINNSYDFSSGNTSLELGGIVIGDLFYLKNQVREIATLSLFEFLAYLVECELTDISLSNYTFKENYLFIHEDFADEYHSKYNNTSTIWGGYKIMESVCAINYYKKTINSILIPDELKELDPFAKDSIFRALDQKHSFERFLKFYHLLELEFDYSLIKKIQSLNIETESNLIGSLLNDYNRSENDRLFELISNSCFDINGLALKLNNIKNYQVFGEEIFIKFGKSKPNNFLLNDLFKYNALLTDVDSFVNSSSVNTYTNVKVPDYPKFIHSVSAYWIYRIRCSIAHFKIGEYILTRDKEEFIVEFAEPLIKEVLIQFYKK